MEFVGEKRRAAYASRRLEEFSEHCRSKGLAITPQRMAVAEALLSSGDHPRADQVYAEVRKLYPHVSLATIHRTLETLCKIGEARKVTPLHDSARYDGNLNPHHHVVCVRCRRVRDVVAPEFDALLHSRSTLGEFKLLGCSVEVRALCRRCKRVIARQLTSAAG